MPLRVVSASRLRWAHLLPNDPTCRGSLLPVVRSVHAEGARGPSQVSCTSTDVLPWLVLPWRGRDPWSDPLGLAGRCGNPAPAHDEFIDSSCPYPTGSGRKILHGGRDIVEMRCYPSTHAVCVSRGGVALFTQLSLVAYRRRTAQLWGRRQGAWCRDR